MRPDQVEALEPALSRYLDEFQSCFEQKRTRRHLHTYCRGLLSDLPRKTVEPIASAEKVPVRTLQEFLRDHVWDEELLLDLLQKRIARYKDTPSPGSLGPIGIVVSAILLKKGAKSPGVVPEGRNSHINIIALGLTWGRFQSILAADLYIPYKWIIDQERRIEAQIPKRMPYRNVSTIASDQMSRLEKNGLHLNWWIRGNVYNENYYYWPNNTLSSFIHEVGQDFKCEFRSKTNRNPKQGWRRQSINKLSEFTSGHSYNSEDISFLQVIHSEQAWEIGIGRVYSIKWANSETGYWLIVARNLKNAEKRYFFSNAPVQTPLATLAELALSYETLTQPIRDIMSEFGFWHFEGRSYKAMRRHMILSQLVSSFVGEWRAR